MIGQAGPCSTVAVIAYDGMSAFEIGIVTEVFGLPRPEFDRPWYVVRLDHGAAIANAAARRLVIPPHRSGGQAQFIETPVTADPVDDRITGSMTWALAHLGEAISVATLAGRAHMSTRTYLRHFSRATGTTPVRWLITQRVQASLVLLETTNTPIEQIAAAVGFDTPVTYRHHSTG